MTTDHIPFVDRFRGQLLNGHSKPRVAWAIRIAKPVWMAGLLTLVAVPLLMLVGLSGKVRQPAQPTSLAASGAATSHAPNDAPSGVLVATTTQLDPGVHALV